MSEPLTLDLVRSGRSSPWAAWLLLALSIAFAAETARSYKNLLEDTAVKSARLAHARLNTQPSPKESPRVDGETIKFARETIARLSMPWSELFRSLEAAKTDRVALMEIDPDPSTGIVTIAGDAKDYLAVLTYVMRLTGEPTLTDVRLTRHEELASQRGYAFTILAQWRRNP